MRASANTKRFYDTGPRAVSKRWAAYRDTLADEAIGEWNVLARRWAAACQTLGPRRDEGDPWDLLVHAGRRNTAPPGPTVVPITLNL